MGSNNKWREVIDVLLDAETGDLLFENGDFALGDATTQHQAHNLIADKGDLRASPQAGIGMTVFLNDESLEDGEAQAAIALQLELDGPTVASVAVDNGQVQIDSGWEKR